MITYVRIQSLPKGQEHLQDIAVSPPDDGQCVGSIVDTAAGAIYAGEDSWQPMPCRDFKELPAVHAGLVALNRDVPAGLDARQYVPAGRSQTPPLEGKFRGR